MTQITVTAQQQNGHIIYICNETEQPYVNQAQLKKIFPNVPESTIERRFKDTPKEQIKIAVIESGGRKYDTPLAPASVVYDLAFEFDLPLAKQMGAAGASVYLYGLAGYQVKASKPMTPAEVLIHQGQLMRRLEIQAEEQAQELARQAAELERVKTVQALEAARVDELTDLTHQHDAEIDRIFAPNGRYYSIIGYASLHKLNVSRSQAQSIGMLCSKYCKNNGIAIEKLFDARYGQIGSYPETVIERFLDAMVSQPAN